MKNFELGRFSLTRIVESNDPHLYAKNVFPDWNRELIKPHLDWMIPRHFLPNEEKLVIVIQSFLIKTPHHTILVDTCGGNHKERHGSFFHQRQWNWIDKLAEAGASPQDIDLVLCTHLHVDHVGWNTKLKSGKWIPTFPNAKYIFSRREYNHWKALATETGLPRTGNYFSDSILPIVEAEQALMVDASYAPEDGVWLESFPGHTPDALGMHLKSNGDEAILCGDLMHHKLQCHLPDWSTNFCTDQNLARKTRSDFLKRYADTDTLIFPAHFPEPTGGHIESTSDGFTFRFIGE